MLVRDVGWQKLSNSLGILSMSRNSNNFLRLYGRQTFRHTRLSLIHFPNPFPRLFLFIQARRFQTRRLSDYAFSLIVSLVV